MYDSVLSFGQHQMPSGNFTELARESLAEYQLSRRNRLLVLLKLLGLGMSRAWTHGIATTIVLLVLFVSGHLEAAADLEFDLIYNSNPSTVPIYLEVDEPSISTDPNAWVYRTHTPSSTGATLTETVDPITGYPQEDHAIESTPAATGTYVIYLENIFLGNRTTPFTLNIYHNGSLIATRTFPSLARGSYIAIPFSWGATILPKLAVSSSAPGAGTSSDPTTSANASRVSTGTATASDDPIRYSNGEIILSADDLASAGFNGWGHRRSYSNINAPSANLNGLGWFINQRPCITQSGSTITVTQNASRAYQFTLSNGFYLSASMNHETLEYLQVPGTSPAQYEFVFTDTLGNQTRYFDLTGVPTPQLGAFKSYTDAGGNITTAMYDGNGYLTSISHSITVGSVTTTERFRYVNDATNHWITNVYQETSTDGVTFSIIRQAQYEYYTGSGDNGILGNLKRVTISDGGGNTIDRYAYRYYLSGDPHGTAGSLKYVINPASYARLNALSLDPTTCSESNLTNYGGRYLADHYFEYDSSARVVTHTLQGAGTSDGNGTGTYAYTYTASSNATDPNNWAMETSETDPNGNVNTIFSNGLGEVMLRDFEEMSSGLHWITYSQYDSAGREILRAEPSAFVGVSTPYSTSTANLGVSMGATSGLIRTFTYGTTTTSGDVEGYLKSESVQQGSSGTPILQHSLTYTSNTDANAETVYPVASDTVYRNTDGTGAEVTSYAYTFLSTTNRVYERDTSRPIVSSAENGPGTVDVLSEVYDIFGRVNWVKDEDGDIGYIAIDAVTGGILKRIVDVDTTRTSDFANLPSGWSSSGTRLHLITSTTVDPFGRTTSMTTPRGIINYWLYDDVNHSVREYPGWTGSATTGPTKLWREDRPGSYAETLTMTATPAVSGGVPTGAEGVSNVQTLSRVFHDDGGRDAWHRDYYSLSGLTYSTTRDLGTTSNYYETDFGYDSLGLRCRVKNAVGTISRSVHDSRGRIASEWIGTNDTPTSGTWSPSNTTGTNLIKVEDFQYDSNGVGDGNLTQTAKYPTSTSSDNRIALQWFDWRDRLMVVKQGYQTTTESGSVNRPIYYYDLDNLGHTTAISRFDGDGVGITVTSGVPQKPTSTLLCAYEVIHYDDQGRVYSRQQYTVDGSANLSPYAISWQTWFNHRGLPVKFWTPNSAFEKRRYDGAGRVTMVQKSDAGGDSSWSDAFNATSDNVLYQEELTYDPDGNVIQRTCKDRNHDETTTGDLGNQSTIPKCRTSYKAAYFDLANRLTDSVDYGTNGGASFTRPASPASRSDTTLVSSLTYAAAGWIDNTTDPRGVVTKYQYDNLGRRTTEIEAYDASINSGQPSGSNNRTTVTTYDGIGHPTSVQAVMPAGTNSQTTAYIYGVTTSGGSVVNSNDLLATVEYPDKSTGSASTSTANQDRFTYNALGQSITKADGNGTTHTYSYDVLGRLITDAVTMLGSGVDGTVRRLQFNFNRAGCPQDFASYNASTGGSVVNDVWYVYNGLFEPGNMYQEHAGSVNTSTSLKVAVGYIGIYNQNVNYLRLNNLTYPNGRAIHYGYASGLNSTISRMTSVNDDNGSGGSGTQTIAYTYMGLNNIVQINRVEEGVSRLYIKNSGESTGDAGDQYVGLDRFGRVVDQRWRITGNTTYLDRFQYAYDRAGNKLYKNNALTSNESELYHANGASTNGAYDPFGRMTAFQRGTLSASGSNGSTLDTVSTVNDPNTADPIYGSQSWSLDQLNNWSSVTSDGTGITRTHNSQNQFTGDGTNTYGFDNNGNLTTQTGQTTNVYDAWNRPVSIRGTTYVYDALGRRIKETTGSTTKHYFYDRWWRVVETRLNSNTYANEQFVYSADSIDAPVLRDRDSDGNGSTGTLGSLSGGAASGLDERLYYQYDADYNVTGLVSQTGQTVVERMAYDPYGDISYFDASWTARSGSSYANNIGFTGRWHDSTGMIYFRNRYYDPVLGRFVQRDPMGYAGGGMSLYCGYFVPNGMDPMGLCPDSPNYQMMAQMNAALATHDMGDVDMNMFFAQEAAAIAQANHIVDVYNTQNVLGQNWTWDTGEQLTQTTAAMHQAQEPVVLAAGFVLAPQAGAFSFMTASAADYVAPSVSVKAMLTGSDTTPAIVNVGNGIPDSASGGLFRAGLYDPDQGAVYVGPGGHFDGGAGLGAQARIQSGSLGSATPGISTVETQNSVYWANDSLSLPQALTDQQAASVHAGFESAFPGKNVIQLESIGQVPRASK